MSLVGPGSWNRWVGGLGGFASERCCTHLKVQPVSLGPGAHMRKMRGGDRIARTPRGDVASWH